METDGIHVDEIDLNLGGACYYLYWEPPVPGKQAAHRRARRHAIRGIGDRLQWTLYATGVSSGACRMLFATAESNLDTGLAALLGGGARHCLYMVHPESALQPAARFIHECDGNDSAPAVAAGAAARLPDVHYGLFMGERLWAEQTLALLVDRCRKGGGEANRRSLADITGMNADRRRAIAEAYLTDGYTLKDIARYFDMHFSEVSAVINASGSEGRG